jgi:hypothetical protein
MIKDTWKKRAPVSRFQEGSTMNAGLTVLVFSFPGEAENNSKQNNEDQG